MRFLVEPLSDGMLILALSLSGSNGHGVKIGDTELCKGCRSRGLGHCFKRTGPLRAAGRCTRSWSQLATDTGVCVCVRERERERERIRGCGFLSSCGFLSWVWVCAEPLKDCSRHGVKLVTLTHAVHVHQPTSSGKRDREKVQYLRSNGSRQDKRVKMVCVCLCVCVCVCVFAECAVMPQIL